MKLFGDLLICERSCRRADDLVDLVDVNEMMGILILQEEKLAKKIFELAIIGQFRYDGKALVDNGIFLNPKQKRLYITLVKNKHTAFFRDLPIMVNDRCFFFLANAQDHFLDKGVFLVLYQRVLYQSFVEKMDNEYISFRFFTKFVWPDIVKRCCEVKKFVDNPQVFINQYARNRLKLGSNDLQSPVNQHSKIGRYK